MLWKMIYHDFLFFSQDQNNWRAQVLDKSDTAAFVGLWMQSVDTEVNVFFLLCIEPR